MDHNDPLFYATHDSTVFAEGRLVCLGLLPFKLIPDILRFRLSTEVSFGN